MNTLIIFLLNTSHWLRKTIYSVSHLCNKTIYRKGYSYI